MNLTLYNIFKVFALFAVLMLVVWFLDWIYYKVYTEKGKWKKLE